MNKLLMMQFSYLINGPKSPVNPTIEEIESRGDVASLRSWLAEVKKSRGDKSAPFVHAGRLAAGGYAAVLEFRYIGGTGSIWSSQQRFLRHVLVFAFGPGVSGTPGEALRIVFLWMQRVQEWQDSRTADGLKIESRSPVGDLLNSIIRTRPVLLPPSAKAAPIRALSRSYPKLAKGEDESLDFDTSTAMALTASDAVLLLDWLGWIFGPDLELVGDLPESAGSGKTASLSVTLKMKCLRPTENRLPDFDARDFTQAPPGEFWNILVADPEKASLARISQDATALEKALEGPDQLGRDESLLRFRQHITASSIRAPESRDILLQKTIGLIADHRLVYSGSGLELWETCLDAAAKRIPDGLPRTP